MVVVVVVVVLEVSGDIVGRAIRNKRKMILPRKRITTVAIVNTVVATELRKSRPETVSRCVRRLPAKRT